MTPQVLDLFVWFFFGFYLLFWLVFAVVGRNPPEVQPVNVTNAICGTRAVFISILHVFVCTCNILN